MTDYLDEIQARADAAVATQLAAPHDSPWWTVHDSATDVPRLVAFAKAVLAACPASPSGQPWPVTIPTDAIRRLADQHLGGDR